MLFTTGHSEPGGCARHSSTLSSGLAARGWDVRTVCRAGTLSRVKTERAGRLRVIEIPGFGRRAGAVLFLAVGVPLGLWWGRQASFVAFQLSSPTLAGGLCALALRRPFVALATTSGQNSETSEIVQSRRRRLHRALLARASFLVGQTDGAAQELQNFVPPGRVAVIPTPMATAQPTPLSGSPSVAYTGRFSRDKDLPLLLDAWEQVARDRPNASLTLVGEGGRYESVEPLLRQMVCERSVLKQSVAFTGWVPDVTPFLKDADVYAFPSRTEGMSNSLLEACALRRVVVATDIAANKAVLGDDYPLLFPAGDAAHLAATLTRALDDDQARSDALAQIDERLHLFSVDAVLDRLEALLRAADRSRH